MKSYIVRLRRVLEWENVVEADTPQMAEELAALEAHHGTIVDELIYVEEIGEPIAAVD